MLIIEWNQISKYKFQGGALLRLCLLEWAKHHLAHTPKEQHQCHRKACKMMKERRCCQTPGKLWREGISPK